MVAKCKTKMVDKSAKIEYIITDYPTGVGGELKNVFSVLGVKVFFLLENI